MTGPSASVPYERFSSNKCKWHFFERKVEGLLHERDFKMEEVEEKTPTFYAMLHTMKWETMVEESDSCNELMVWEFYTNLPTADWKSRNLVVYV